MSLITVTTIKAGKRTIFVGKKKFFLEFPQLKFEISALPSWHNDQRRVLIRFTSNKYLLLHRFNFNLPEKNFSVCLGQDIFPDKNFEAHVISRFFNSKFSKTIKHDCYFYFLDKWQKYGIKYHDILVKMLLNTYRQTKIDEVTYNKISYTKLNKKEREELNNKILKIMKIKGENVI